MARKKPISGRGSSSPGSGCHYGKAGLGTSALLPGRIVLGGVARVPVSVTLSTADVRAGVAATLADLPVEDRWTDLRADWDYRGRVAPEIAARAWAEAEGAPA